MGVVSNIQGSGEQSKEGF